MRQSEIFKRTSEGIHRAGKALQAHDHLCAINIANVGGFEGIEKSMRWL